MLVNDELCNLMVYIDFIWISDMYVCIINGLYLKIEHALVNVDQS